MTGRHERAEPRPDAKEREEQAAQQARERGELAAAGVAQEDVPQMAGNLKD